MYFIHTKRKTLHFHGFASSPLSTSVRVMTRLKQLTVAVVGVYLCKNPIQVLNINRLIC